MLYEIATAVLHCTLFPLFMTLPDIFISFISKVFFAINLFHSSLTFGGLAFKLPIQLVSWKDDLLSDKNLQTIF